MEKKNNSILLQKNWFIQSSKNIIEKGEVLSSPGYSPTGWYPATIPSTVLNTLVKNNVYKDIYFGKNFDKIPTDPFKVSWWYMTKFSLPKATLDNTFRLEFDGIIYRANIWLNGKKIANSDQVFGAFRRFEFDISNIVLKGKENILAVEVFPPVPGEPTVGFVDWNPKPADNSMGIWREVRIKAGRNVSIKFPFVKSEVDIVSLKKAKLNITLELQNNSDKKIDGVLEGEIEKIRFSKEVMLESGETKLITFSPNEYEQLIINNPRLWWTHDLGKPEMYILKLQFKSGNDICDLSETKFGIRDIKDYINEIGFRGFKINGRKILIKGGGWTDNVLLDNDHQNLLNQIRYVKHMNLNAIRVEGFWGTNEDLYNICDEFGILVLAGWSCQWEWENLIGKKCDNFGGIETPEEIKLIADSWRDQIKWLRNHPSIFVWLYGSDLIPRPELEKEYQSILLKDDPTRPFLASAKEHNSKVTGKTAVKMRGPYDYVPPHYWYIDTANGGAFGLNTETGPGPQVPPLESIKKMIPADSLWPLNTCWDFHCCRGKFKNLTAYNSSLNARLGAAKNLEDYCMKAQLMNYEAIRGMFESFEANRFLSTGVIQWMLNSAWPKLWWQLYDFYLMPNAAFYGTKKSCEPVHILYNYSTNEISVINNTIEKIENLNCTVRVLNLDLTEKFSKKVAINVAAYENSLITVIPDISDLSKTYFLDLRISDKKGNLISNNFYWLSTKMDVLDWKASNWFVTPIKEYADFSDLNDLPKTKVNYKFKFTKKNDIQEIEVNLQNETDKIAFFIDFSILKGKDGESVLPVFWDDNYITLMPGEKRTIKGHFYDKDLGNNQPFFKLSGWNIIE